MLVIVVFAEPVTAGIEFVTEAVISAAIMINIAAVTV
jgi:hypothetical protein